MTDPADQGAGAERKPSLVVSPTAIGLGRFLRV